MSRDLLIMRHAQSGWDATSDFERTLTSQGGSDALCMGSWLSEAGQQPDYILASPAQRAKETVLAVCKVLEIDPQQIHWEPRIYEASIQTLVELLQGIPEEAERILLVGHNPGLAELVLLLLGDLPAGFAPANIAWLDLDAVQPKGARLKQWVRPSDVL